MKDINNFFAGVSSVRLAVPEYDLGDGLLMRNTYAHLFAPFMMAFKPPGKQGYHEAPWKTAGGGFAFDILMEIEIPEFKRKKNTFDAQELSWILVSMIRLCNPYALAPAISNMSFDKILNADKEPIIKPFEIIPRIFSGKENSIIEEMDLLWIKENWKNTVKLLKENTKFYSAFRAFDNAGIQQKPSVSLLMIWGAIEQLFSSHQGELKYRVSSNLASYLETDGVKRLALFNELSALYNQRSTAAHTSKDIDYAPVVSSYVYLRNAIVKIIDEGIIPSQNDLLKMLFNANEA